MLKAEPTCYMCNRPATTSEHVPPIGIFPKRYRRNLIKVWSCDVHNGDKSKDDELFRYVIATHPRNNKIALEVIDDKVLKRFKEKPHLITTFMPDLRPVTLGSMQTGVHSIDLKRFNHSIECIVRGLFYKDIGRKLMADLIITNAALVYSDLSDVPYLNVVESGERVPWIYKGENPEVFRYSILKHEQTWVCRLQFYEGIPIYVSWLEN